MYDTVPASPLAGTGAAMAGVMVADPRVCSAVCACMHVLVMRCVCT